MLEDGLSYPDRGDWIGRINIDSVPGFAVFLVLLLLALDGYQYRVMEGTIEGENVPAAFTEWGEGELLVRGDPSP